MTLNTDRSATSIPLTQDHHKEWRFVLLTSLGVMLLTLVPYFIGAGLAEGRVFMWLGYNLDDSCVYLSWMRQAADGSYSALNLFTTEPQQPMLLNPLFLTLGVFSRLTSLSLLAVYHLARIGFGFALLLIVYRFFLLTVADYRARRLSFLFVCFSAGLGWLPFWWQAPPIETPIDKWQPEAITFLSLYLSPLFCASMLLQVGLLTLLLRGERTGQARYSLYAGLCGFLLGLIHSYDVITIAAIWTVYLIALTILRRSHSPQPEAILHSWYRAILAGVLTAPAVGIIYLQYRNNPLFNARANVATLSPSLFWALAGYGLTLVLAVLGCYAYFRHQRPTMSEATDSANSPPSKSGETTPNWFVDKRAALLLSVWMIVNIAVSYLPRTPFQRKLLQGAHFPIAIWAGIGAVYLLTYTRWKVPDRYFTLAGGLLTLLLSITNLSFMLRDAGNFINNRVQTMLERPYLQSGELQALDWVAAHTPSGAAIQPLPWLQSDPERHKYGPTDITLACFMPGLIHRAVYCGHWGETPDFGAKLSELGRFALPRTPDADRIALLRKMNVRYLIFSQKSPVDPSADLLLPMFRGRVPLPSYLTRIYSNEDADVYAVDLSGQP